MNKTVKEILSYVIIIVIVLLIKKYIFSPIRVNGNSMYPTLHNKDIMILNEIGYYINGLERFDIIVIKNDGDYLIKRVIGLPGEKVSIKNNKLLINDEEISEDFSHAITDDFDLGMIDEEIIPDDYYFVMGDNRGDSLDSRTFGLIKKSRIMGKTNYIIFPFSRFGQVK